MPAFAIFHNMETSLPVLREIVSHEDTLSGIIEGGTPVAMERNLERQIWRCKTGPFVLARVSYTRSDKKTFLLKIRASFNGTLRTQLWTLTTALSVSSNPGEGIPPAYSRLAGHSRLTTDAVFSRQMEVLTTIFAIILDPEGPVRNIVSREICRHDRAQEGSAILRAICHGLRNADIDDLADQVAIKDARTARLRALPHGTPLVIRPGLFSSSWQLGAVRKSLPKTLAQHARLATPEEIAGDELAAAGLSRHSALLMSATAHKAVIADPDLAAFQNPTKSYGNILGLDANKPFHDTFGNPEGARARRARMPKIWIQTSFRSANTKFRINGSKAQHYSGLPYPTGTLIHPGFPGKDRDVPHISFFQAVGKIEEMEPLMDIDRICCLWTVSKRLAELLADHDLGSSELRPVEIQDIEGSVTEDRLLLVVREDRPSLIKSRTPIKILKNLQANGVANHEVAVDGERHGTLDLWTDSSFSNHANPLFFSDVLKKRIDRDKITARIGLRICDAV